MPGRNAHLVHYPVKGGRLINVVAILRDDWNEPGWSAPGAPRRARAISGRPMAGSARELLRASEHWQNGPCSIAHRCRTGSKGPATLIGDAAHPMLPYLAQGAAMAIEDAAVLADCLGETPDDAAGALRRYESMRLPRTTKTQRAARRNGSVYHMGGAEFLVRVLARFTMSGDKLLKRYDWLYGWKP